MFSLQFRAAWLVAGWLVSAAFAAGDPLQVTTASGPVLGSKAGGVRRFLGIPYAAPPVGARRWQPAAAPAPWTAPRPALVGGAPCVQTLPIVNIESGNEDCLFVNVFTPDPPPRRPAAVMVWIHGGGFTVGGGLDNDPSELVARTGVVVVTVNYRLGPFGFLAHPALTAETPGQAAGNFGLQDQQAALAWVQQNVRAFGGNPKNVTIFGESAGGISVCAHLVAPGSKGLFRRAITQSGPCVSGLPARAAAEAQGQRFAQVLACDGAPDVIACLRGRSAQDVLHALPPDPTFLFDRSVNWTPTADGSVLPADIPDAFRSGKAQRVPLIIGVNRDEGRLFVGLAFNVNFGPVMPHPITAPDWPGRVNDYFGPTVGPEVQQRYPLADYPDPNAAFGQAIGDAILACPAIESAHVLAERMPVFLYQFEHEPNPFVLPMVGITLGAFHAAELPYVFGGAAQSSGSVVFTPAEQKLVDFVTGAWGRFAKRGHPGTTRGAWPRLRRQGKYQVLDTPPKVAANLKPDLCGFWKTSGFTLAAPAGPR